MKRLEINPDQNNFIGCWKSTNHKLFDNMVDFFEKNISLPDGFVLHLIDQSKKKIFL